MSVELVHQQLHHLSMLGKKSNSDTETDFNLICDEIDSIMNTENELLDTLLSMNITGLIAPTGYGTLLLSPSAKTQGKWQVTAFNQHNLPLSDRGDQDLRTALEQLFEDLNFHTLNIDEFCRQLA